MGRGFSGSHLEEKHENSASENQTEVIIRRIATDGDCEISHLRPPDLFEPSNKL